MPNGHYETVMKDAPSETCACQGPSQPNGIPEQEMQSASPRQGSTFNTEGEIPVFVEKLSNRVMTSLSGCPNAELQSAHLHSFTDFALSSSCAQGDSLLTTSLRTEHRNENRKPAKAVVVQPQTTPLAPTSHPESPAEEPNPPRAGRPPQSLTDRPNVAVSSVPVCRICHDGEEQEPLASMCKCSGSVGLVHASCLERWLNIRNSDNCELCQHRYPTTIAHCSSLVRVFRWLRQYEAQRRRAMCTHLSLFTLMPLFAVLGCYLSVHTASSQAFRNHGWSSVSLVVLTGFLLTASIVLYMAWSFLIARLHYVSCRSWQSKNPIRRLLLMPPTRSCEPSHNGAPEEVERSEEQTDVVVESISCEKQPTLLQREYL